MLKRFKKLLATWLLGSPDSGSSQGVDSINMECHVARDAELSGWMNFASGELIGGFSISRNDTVLDIGCGDGAYAKFCASQGANLILADVNPVAVAHARRMVGEGTGGLISLVTDSAPLPLADASVTRIMALEVMEHVDNPDQFLGELVRVGSRGSLYFIAVPAAQAEHLQKDLAPPGHFEKPNHIHIFERLAFLKLIEDSGLIVERELSYGFYKTLWWIFFWACKQDLAPPWHPLLENWRRTWVALLDTPQGPQIKSILDGALPKSQAVIARKP